MNALLLHTAIEAISFPTLLTQDNQPKVELIQVMGMAGMKTPSVSLEKINEWGQKNLLRKEERWSEQDATLEHLKDRMTPLLKELGMKDATAPTRTEYQGAIVHGSTLDEVRLRLHYLIEQWKKGVRFHHIYFLTGSRPLNMSIENSSCCENDDESPLKIRKGWTLSSPPKTEYEMVVMIWDQSEVPEGLRKSVTVEFVQAPMKQSPTSEKLERPTTDDTVVYWLKNNPVQGRYLAVSNAPFTPRQDLVVRTFLTDEYELETIGPALDNQLRVAIILDELARLIYQTTQFINIKSLDS